MCVDKGIDNIEHCVRQADIAKEEKSGKEKQMQELEKTKIEESLLSRDLMVSRNKIINKRMVSLVHYHEEYELYYMLDGGTTYFIDGEIFSINKGNFVFIPSGLSHQTDNQNYRHNERILISFRKEIFPETNQYILEELAKSRVIYVPDTQLPVLEALLFKIEAEFKQEEKGKSVLMDLYIQELLTLLYRYKCERKSIIQESDKIVYTISEYIRSNYSQDINLKSLSEKFAISEGHLSRKFKAVSGLGVNQYITYVRISHAEKLLRDGDLSVTEIAEKCGFCGSTYFASVFRKVKGVAPLAYRKLSKECILCGMSEQ